MRALLALILALSSCATLAGEDPKLAAAQRLVELLQIDEIYEDAQRACSDAANAAASAGAAYAANPQVFGGLSPRSAYWPEVESLYRRYRLDACSGSTAESAKQIYARIFAQRLSRQELEAAAAHMATPEGQAMQAASREAARVLSIQQAVAQEEATAAATRRFRDGMRALTARYKAAPR